MTTIWYLPLEHLDMRYTDMMDKKIIETLEKNNKTYKRIYGKELTKNIDTGAFLDSEGTNYFKASQIMKVCELFKKNKIKDKDKFFISDLWFPGLEAIPYMANFKNIDIEIYGIFHAGSWTDTDYVNSMKEWARPVERGWINFCKGIFLGSEFIKQDMIRKFQLNPKEIEKLHVTGLVYDSKEIEKYKSKKKEDIIVFPHRLDDEKQPYLFDEFIEKIKKVKPNIKSVKTHELHLKKEDYLKLLGKSKIMFSAALQENFGYATLESCSLGVVPVVPNRLSYRDFYPKKFRYETIDEAVEIALKYLDNPVDLSYIPKRFDNSVDRMIDIMCSK